MIGDWASVVVFSGSLLLALPIGATAGLLSFSSRSSRCCLPLVPGYLSLDAQAALPAPGRPGRRPAAGSPVRARVNTMHRSDAGCGSHPGHHDGRGVARTCRWPST